MRSPSGRIPEWVLQHQEYDYDVVYRSERKHFEAGVLSRYPIELLEPDESIKELPLAVLNDINLATEQPSDSLLRNIIEPLRESAQVASGTKKNIINHAFCDDILL